MERACNDGPGTVATWIASWQVFRKVAAATFVIFLPLATGTWVIRAIVEPLWHGTINDPAGIFLAVLARELAIATFRATTLLVSLGWIHATLHGTRPRFRLPRGSWQGLPLLVVINLVSGLDVVSLFPSLHVIAVTVIMTGSFIVQVYLFTVYAERVSHPDVNAAATLEAAAATTRHAWWECLLVVVATIVAIQVPPALVHGWLSGMVDNAPGVETFVARGIVVTLVQASLAGLLPSAMHVSRLALGSRRGTIQPGELPPGFEMLGMPSRPPRDEGGSRGQEMDPPVVAVNACPECNAPVPPDATTCPACTFPVYRCPSCFNVFDDETGTCPVCGEAVKDATGSLDPAGEDQD